MGLFIMKVTILVRFSGLMHFFALLQCIHGRGVSAPVTGFCWPEGLPPVLVVGRLS